MAIVLGDFRAAGLWKTLHSDGLYSTEGEETIWIPVVRECR